MDEQRPRSRVGWFVVLTGVLTALLVYTHPEGLEAPAWVAYAACIAFVFAGLSIVASSAAHSRAQTWLAIGCMAAMAVPGMWIAFWPGPRVCSVSIPFASGAVQGGVCRVAFGSGAVIVAVFVVWAVRRALKPAPAPE
jgi:hypothetical protein